MPSSHDDAPVVLVTGASRGLGRAVVLRLAELGCRVATCSTGGQGPGVGEALHQRTDVTDPRAVDQLVGAVVARWGRIDALVNNAGFSPRPAPILEASDEDAQRSLATNLLGPYYLLHRVLPGMVASPGGGVVVNVASRAGITPVPGLAAYSASKAALVALTLAIAKEVTDPRLIAVAVCPGGMDTEMRAAVYGADDAHRQQDPTRVAEVIAEIVLQRTVRGHAVTSGAAVLITKDSGVTVLDWPADERGHASFFAGRAAKG
ncbi:MAG: SDR family NAD(P)-dependent oxidoreductase [Thermoplasmata archaeon]